MSKSNRTSSSSGITLEEEYKLLASQRQIEQTLLWNRHNFYFFVNGVLMAALTTLGESDIVVFRVVLSVIGLVTSFFWARTARGGLRWTNYYCDLLAEIEDKIGANVKLFQNVREKYTSFGTGRRLAITMRGLPWMFLAAWILLLLWTI